MAFDCQNIATLVSGFGTSFFSIWGCGLLADAASRNMGGAVFTCMVLLQVLRTYDTARSPALDATCIAFVRWGSTMLCKVNA